MLLMRWLAVGVMAAALSGCSAYSLERLRRAEPSGSDFQKALAKLYMEFASTEEKSYDWQDSWYFADKGLVAAYGGATVPERLQDWTLPHGMIPEMQKARDSLVEALGSAEAARQPQTAAAAQFNFDCWVEQQEENWQTGDIAACRDAFYDALAKLGVAIPHGDRDSAPTPVASTSYIIFFNWSQAGLTGAGQEIVDEIVRELADQTGYEVVLNGHADASGGEKYNMKLSMRRAETVKRALVEKGIRGSRIKLFSFGESDPAIPRGDGAREPKNRRVEIFLEE